MYLYRPILLNLCICAPLCAALPVAAELPAGVSWNFNGAGIARNVHVAGVSCSFKAAGSAGSADVASVSGNFKAGGVAADRHAGITSAKKVLEPLAFSQYAGGPAGIFAAGQGMAGHPTPGHSARTLYRKGLRMQRGGRLDEAQQYFESAVKEDAGFVSAYLALADIYRLQQQPEPAKQQLQTVLELDPRSGEALAALAGLHYEQGAWEDALACAFRAQELGRPQMNRLIGLSYARLNHPEEAVSALEKARNAGELNGDDLCSAARLHAQLEAFEKSVQYYEESLKAGGNPPAVYYELGMMYFNMKNYKNAAGAFEQASRLGRPADADLYLNLGMAHLKQAAYDDAIAHLQTALSLRPKDIQVILNLANAYYKKQDFKQAAVQWNKILMVQPQNAFAMFMLGKSYMGSGELLKGQAICDQALALGEKY